jgi:hypothetical protein
MTDTESKLTARFLSEIETAVAEADGKGKPKVALKLDDVRMLLELASEGTAATAEVDRLASYILTHRRDEPGGGGRNEGAVDVAITAMAEMTEAIRLLGAGTEG